MTDTHAQVADDVADAEVYEETRDDGREPAAVSSHDVEIRRNAVLSGVLGLVASVLTLAWLVRLLGQGGGAGQWLFTLVLAVIAVVQVRAFLDARVPLLVADSFGVRLRLGREWRGLPWSSLEQVVVEQRTSLLHDGRLVVAPRFMDRALDGLDEMGRRQIAVAQKVYGAPLVVPLGMTTKISTPHLVDALGLLAGGRAAIVELAGHVAEPVQALEEDHLERLEERQNRALHGPFPGKPPAPPARPRELVGAAGPAAGGGGSIEAGGDGIGRTTHAGLSIFDKLGFDQWGLTREHLGLLVSRAAHGQAHDVDAVPVTAQSWTPAVPLRGAKPASRVDVEIEHQPVILGAAAPQLDPADNESGTDDLPEKEILHRGWDDQDGDWQDTSFDVTPQATDLVDPAGIGEQIRTARTRLGFDVETLSERTRIRPHVIEAIEADDFAPCGGDFYARGHLRAIARVLELEAEDLLERFDADHATAPIRASRVFEAELAAGRRGALRATFAGPRWGLMIGVVLVLVLLWGMARLFASDAPQSAAPPSLAGSAGVANQKPITSVFGAPVRLSVRAERGPADVEVRDHTGRVLWSGQLAAGSHRQIVGVGPFTVQASDPSVVDVWLAGKPQGAVGTTTTAGSRIYKR